MLEIHPFISFVPKNAKYLILGSFTGRDYANIPEYDWFYSSPRNQFWKILRIVYNLPQNSKLEKEDLFNKLQIAISDIIYSCERKNNNNLDNNLINITYNIKVIDDIFNKNKIEKIYFTSRFVEKKFKRLFKNFIQTHKNIELVTLPSPSPRYAYLRLEEKVEIYKKLLPKA